MYKVNYKMDYKNIYDFKLPKSAKNNNKAIKTFVAGNIYETVVVRLSDMSDIKIVELVKNTEKMK